MHSPDREIDTEQLRHAAELVVTAQFPSESYLARKLDVGAASAAALMDELERRGYVGPPRGTRQREMRVRPDQLARVLNEIGGAGPVVDRPTVDEYRAADPETRRQMRRAATAPARAAAERRSVDLVPDAELDAAADALGWPDNDQARALALAALTAAARVREAGR